MVKITCECGEKLDDRHRYGDRLVCPKCGWSWRMSYYQWRFEDERPPHPPKIGDVVTVYDETEDGTGQYWERSNPRKTVILKILKEKIHEKESIYKWLVIVKGLELYPLWIRWEGEWKTRHQPKILRKEGRCLYQPEGIQDAEYTAGWVGTIDR